MCTYYVGGEKKNNWKRERGKEKRKEPNKGVETEINLYSYSMEYRCKPQTNVPSVFDLKMLLDRVSPCSNVIGRVAQIS